MVAAQRSPGCGAVRSPRPMVGGAARGMVEEGAGGQAAVELALALPLVAVLLLALVQIGMVLRDQILVVHAAREAAREIAVDPDTQAARRAAVLGSGLDGRRLELRVQGRGRPGSRARATVHYRSATEVPLVGGAIGDVPLTASAAMRVER